MIQDSNSDHLQRRYSRRGFLRTAAGIAMTLLLPACRRGAPPAPVMPGNSGWVDTTRYRKSPPWRLGRVTRGDLSSWQIMLSAHIEYGVTDKYRQYFSEFRSNTANWDSDKQAQDIERLLAANIDVLVLDALSDAPVVAAVSKAMQAGVPVILLSSGMQNAHYVSWVTTDEEERGALCADWLGKQVQGGRVIVLQSEPAMGESPLWLKGVRRLESRTDLSLEVVTCFWWPSDARKAMDTVLAGSSAIQGLVVNSGTVGQGAIEALTERGMAIPPVAGGDDGNGWLRLARQESVRFLGLGGYARLGLRCVERAIDVLSGRPVLVYEEFPYEVFDETALERYYRPDLSDYFWAIHELPEPWIERMFKA